jgi:hypothetical protein
LIQILSSEAEGPEYELLTLNQQMAQQYLPIWGKVKNLNSLNRE